MGERREADVVACHGGVLCEGLAMPPT